MTGCFSSLLMYGSVAFYSFPIRLLSLHFEQHFLRCTGMSKVTFHVNQFNRHFYYRTWPVSKFQKRIMGSLIDKPWRLRNYNPAVKKNKTKRKFRHRLRLCVKKKISLPSESIKLIQHTQIAKLNSFTARKRNPEIQKSHRKEKLENTKIRPIKQSMARKRDKALKFMIGYFRFGKVSKIPPF